MKLLTTLLVAGAVACASNRTLPENTYILPLSAGPELMKQCSRDTPKNVSGFWEPSVEQVIALEDRIDDFFSSWRPPERRGIPSGHLRDYHRQYLGIIVGGKHLIYGNFYSPDGYQSGTEAQKSEVWCDGGPNVFGLEYDPVERKIVDAQVNGAI
jgi:hypothetical protein